MLYIGLDLGATFVKSAVLDTDSMRVLCPIRKPFPAFVGGLPQGRREINPDAILRTTSAVLAEVAPAAPKCAGILVSGQMQCLVLMSAEGAPLTNCISWQDTRFFGGDQDAGSDSSLRKLLTAEQLSQAGNDFVASTPLKALFWLKSRNALPIGAVPVCLMDFVTSAMTGARPQTHATNAAACGCLDLRSRAWHKEIIRSAGLGTLAWPDCVALGARVGETDLKGRSVPVHVAVGDQQAALGGACLSEDEISLNIATGSQVSRLSSSLEPAACQIRPYLDERFLYTITHIPAGRALNCLLQFLNHDCAHSDPSNLWDAAEKAVRDVVKTDLRIQLSFFPGACGSVGSIENMHEANMSLGHVLRAAYESMARNYWDCARKLPQRHEDRLVYSGGLILKSPDLRELIEKQFHLPSRNALSEEDALMGLAIVAKSFESGEAISRISRRLMRASN